MKKFFKATVMSIMVAFLFILILYTIIYFFIGDQIIEAISLVNLVAMDNKKSAYSISEIKLSDENKILEYPEYGAQFGNISIEKINVDLPLFYGDTLDILKNGIGVASAGCFPGEGGTIISMGHNFSSMLARLPELDEKDEIIIETDYGTFTYEVFEKDIIDETDFDGLRIQDEKEMLVLYTCYPINNIGHASQRYVVYANLKK